MASYSNPKTVRSPAAHGPHFEKSSAPAKADRFAQGAKKALPNHNPPQPRVETGPHSHAAASSAANAHMDKMSAPAMSANGKPSSIPSAASTPKSNANTSDRTISQEAAINRT